MACAVCLSDLSSPMEGMCDCFHLHCQAGGWHHYIFYRLGCAVFVDIGCTLLDSEAPPLLVFGDWATCVHCVWDPVVCCILEWEAWSLTPFCLLSSAFPGFLAGVSHRGAGISHGSLSTPCFAWGLSAGALAVLIPLPDPSRTCPIPVCILWCFSQFHGVGCGDFLQHWSMLWPAPLSVWLKCIGGQM